MPMYGVFLQQFHMPRFSDLLITALLPEDNLPHRCHVIAISIKNIFSTKDYLLRKPSTTYQ
jgi:hypothetical protein